MRPRRFAGKRGAVRVRRLRRIKRPAVVHDHRDGCPPSRSCAHDVRSGLRRENRGIPNTDPGKAIACGACGAADGSPDMSCAEDASEAGPGRRITALVKWFMPMKGYGFLEPEDGSADLFCHPAVAGIGINTAPRRMCDLRGSAGDRAPRPSRIFSVDPPATGHGAAKRTGPSTPDIRDYT